jgi:ElaB/YqjD/DUF883 family membrane-anchored ribosome-binding protein
MNCTAPEGQSMNSDISSRPSYGSPSGQSGQSSLADTARAQADQLKDRVGDALDRGRSGMADSTYAARESLTEDMDKLRSDMASIKDTLTRFMSEAGTEAGRTARNVGSAVASQVGTAASGLAEAGAEMASSAKEQAKTFASELENMARKNPLGALAGAVLVGVVIGMMSRGGRS